MATGYSPRAPFPARISQVSLWMIWTWVVLIVLDMGGMIVNIMAYTGAQSEDDRKVIKETFVTFSKTGEHVQRTMIALPSLGLIMHIVLPILTPNRITRLSKDFSPTRTKHTRRWIILVPLMYHMACLAAWSTLLALQTDYVPVLGTNKLPECVKYGDELSQCGMLTAEWILAMVFCLVHLVMLGFLGLLVKNIVYPKMQPLPQKSAPNDLESALARENVKKDTTKSTEKRSSKESSGQVRYHAVLPRGAAQAFPTRIFSTAPRPVSGAASEQLPPYTEVKPQ